MNRDLEERIFNDFPELFTLRNDLNSSLMAFGFECRNGWYNLIYNLCKDIYDYFIEKYGKIPEYFNVVQVKEKFGSLRFYITQAPKEIHDMIYEAEKRSYFICENCGKECPQPTPDKEYKSFYRDKLSWIQTLCDECLESLIEERNLIKDDYISDYQKKIRYPYKSL